MKKKRPDKILLLTTLALIIVGVVALFSASVNESQKDFDNIYGYFLHQMFWGVLGGGLLGIAAYHTSYLKIRRFALPLFLVSLALLTLVFVPGISVATASAQRWLDLGFATLQPAELVKLTFIIYLAAWLETHHNEVGRVATLIPFASFLGALALLLALQPDVSTLGIIVISAASMLFVAGARVRHLLFLGGTALAILAVLIRIAPYRINRITAFLSPEQDPLGISYQINQSLIAVGSGNLWGAGLTQGVQKLRFLPEPMHDSIFAVWSEEAGFMGATAIVILFVIFMWRGMRIAEKAQDKFVKYAAAGITTWIFLQAIVNIGALIGIMPLTGIPLPFISYGSSAMIATLAASGLLLQLSKSSKT